MYHLTVVEAGSSRFRYAQNWFLLRAARQSPFHTSLPDSDGLLAIVDIVDVSPRSLPSSLHGVAGIQISLFSKDTSHTRLGTHSTPVWVHLNELHLQWLYFQIRSHSEILGIRTQTYLFSGVGDTIQNKRVAKWLLQVSHLQTKSLERRGCIFLTPFEKLHSTHSIMSQWS